MYKSTFILALIASVSALPQQLYEAEEQSTPQTAPQTTPSGAATVFFTPSTEPNCDQGKQNCLRNNLKAF
jgi:hypothetical protein